MSSLWRGFRLALIVLCAAVFLVSGGMLIRILIGYAEADKTYDSINEGFETLGDLDGTDTEPDESDAETDTEADKPHVTVVNGLTDEMQSQHDYLMQLKATYPDVVGYISVPSVGINYPVAQTDNNDYYLHHLITGEESTSGSIFLDYRCHPDPTVSKNTVLYGHNMNNGSMFHNVLKVFEIENFPSATVEYITEEGIFIYKPLTVFRANAYEPFWQPSFTSDETFLDFCDEMVSKSWFPDESQKVEYGADSGLITLITCTNSVNNADDRFVYQAVLDRVYLASGE